MGRDHLALTSPILGILILLTWMGLAANGGKVNDRNCPGFLNLGKPKPRSHIEVKACSNRFSTCCKTADGTALQSGLVFLASVKAWHWLANVGRPALAGMTYSLLIEQALIRHDLDLYQSLRSPRA